MRIEPRFMRRIARLWHDFDGLEESERRRLRSEVAGILYCSLLLVAGLGWLTAASDLDLVRAAWPELLLLLLLAALLNRLDFFWIVERRAGTYDRWSAPLGGLVTVSAALLFGP